MSDFATIQDADGVTTIIWNCVGRPMNVMTEQGFLDLDAIVDSCITDETVKGVIISSAKADFAAGMDLAVISKIKKKTPENPAQGCFDVVMQIHKILRKIELAGMDFKTKKGGKPWEVGKAFERSAPMGTLTKIEESGNMDSGKITLTVNGDVKQDGDLNQIIWKIPRMIAHLSTFYDITAGDIIMTGTPAGVGPVVKGDKLIGTIDKLNPLEVIVV